MAKIAIGGQVVALGSEPGVYYGGVGDGVANDLSALQAAADMAAANGGVLGLVPGKTYKIVGNNSPTGKLVIKGACRGAHSQLHSYGNPAIAVELSTGNAPLPTRMLGDVDVDLPHIVNMTKTAPGWAGMGEGLRVINVINSRIAIPYVYGFNEGVRMTAYGTAGTGACAYNKIQLGYLFDNKVGIRVAALASGYCNENTYYDGRFQINAATEGVNVAGTRYISIEDGADYPSNHHRFIAPSLEGIACEYTVWLQGTDCLFFNARWEGAPKVRLVAGVQQCKNNAFIGGYSLRDVVWTSEGSVFGNTIQPWEYGQATLSTDIALRLATISTSRPHIAGFPPNTPVWARDSDSPDWLYRLNEQRFVGRWDAGSAYPTLEIDWHNGKIKMGPGNAPFDVSLTRSANAWWIDDGALWVDDYVTARRLSLNNGSAEVASWTPGNGSPEGVVAAPKGSLYSQQNATDGTSPLWVKCSGTGKTGWKRATVS